MKTNASYQKEIEIEYSCTITNILFILKEVDAAVNLTTSSLRLKQINSLAFASFEKAAENAVVHIFNQMRYFLGWN